MNITDHLTTTLDRLEADGHAGPDLVFLTVTARRRGTGLRRRRQAAAGLLGGAAAVVLAVGALSVVGGPSGGLTGGSAADVAGQGSARWSDGDGAPVAVVEPTGAATPTTGPAAALGLLWAVDQQRDGSGSDLAAQLFTSSGDQYAELRWDDADGLGASPVGINVQHERGMYRGCEQVPRSAGCEETRLPDGTLMTTYERRESVDGGVALIRAVDVWRTDRHRVSVTSRNGFEGAGGVWELTRTAPPLSFADLERIARLPLWDETMPASLVEAGARTDVYDSNADRGDWVRGPANP